MKIRNDFVTNSSSSSFILARKPEINDKQKEAIIQFVEENLLGKVILTPDSTEEEIQEAFEDHYEFEDDDKQREVRRLLKEGKCIYADWVSFEECEYSYAYLFEKLWQIMEQNSDDDNDFVTIDGDLSY